MIFKIINKNQWYKKYLSFGMALVIVLVQMMATQMLLMI